MPYRTNRPRPLLIKEILHAQSVTRSHSEAARYLNVSFVTYKKYAQLYDLYENGHKNQSGRGMFKKRFKGKFGLDDILDGNHPSYNRNKLKDRLIQAGYLKQECSLCGRHTVRPNGIGPYTIDYIDGNRLNLNINNLRLLCYNCYFENNGSISIESLEKPVSLRNNPGVYQHDQLETLGIDDLNELREDFIKSQFSSSFSED